MRPINRQYVSIAIFVSAAIFFSSCLTSKKMDQYLASQYDNEIPKLNKNKIPEITINSNIASVDFNISNTKRQTDKFLPLIFYWQIDQRHTVALNPAIAVNSFSNTINKVAGKALRDNLIGKKLSLTVEEVPRLFALVDKERAIWLVYAITWQKIYIEPDHKDLVVSYQLTDNDHTIKTGKISIKNSAENNDVNFFQSWRSATSEFLANYDAAISDMTKAFVHKLNEEI